MKCVERRVTDSAVLRLLRQWLTAPVEERDENGRPRRSRPTRGTPQGGVISPLLANLYLHWFEVRFHRAGGPGVWARARLVRYADDFVIMARHIGEGIPAWVESTVEGWLGLTINREKTRIVRLTPASPEGLEAPEALDFLGYTFRYDWDQYGRGTRYFTAVPSAKAMARVRSEMRALIGVRQRAVPLSWLIARVNRKLRGWKNYFSFGRPRRAHRALNAFVVTRLTHHLQRRSQRPSRLPEGSTWYGYLTRTAGLELG